MKERRFSDPAVQDAVAALLASAADDAPPRGLERKVRVALGIGGVALAGTASTTAAASSKLSTLLGSLATSKLVSVVAVGGGLAIGAAGVHHYATTRSENAAKVATVQAAGAGAAPHDRGPARAAPLQARSAPVVPAVDPAALPAPAPQVPAPGTPVTSPTTAAAAPQPGGLATGMSAGIPGSAPPRAGAAAGAAAEPAAAAAAPTPRPAPTLQEELDMLDLAKKALDSGDPQLALTRLDAYDLRFMGGALAHESLFLRLGAYAKRGDSSKVRELGTAFLSRYPNDPQAPTVRAMLGAQDPGHDSR